MAATLKLAAFDLDGTLLDTIADLSAVGNRVLRESGFAEHEVDVFKRKLVGEGAHEMMRRALASVCDDEATISRLTEQFRLLYFEDAKKHTKPYDGVTGMLRSLRKQGILTAVLSNKPHPATVQMVERYFPGLFDRVLGQREGVPLKPDPAALLELCGQLDINTKPARERLASEEAQGSECAWLRALPGVVYIGDSLTDLFTAQNAGIACISVSWGFRTKDELQGYGAEAIVDDAMELERKIVEFFEA